MIEHGTSRVRTYQRQRQYQLIAGESNLTPRFYELRTGKTSSKEAIAAIEEAQAQLLCRTPRQEMFLSRKALFGPALPEC